MKLLVAGDSFSYGHNLKDRHLNSWPNVLSRRLGVQLIDKSCPGVSNQYIINTVIDTLHTQTIENCIIGFTDIARYELFQNNKLVQINPSSRARQSKEVEQFDQLFFKNFYNECYLLKNFINQVSMLESFLIKKKIKYTFFNAFGNRKIIIKNYKKINLNILNSITFLGWPYDDMNTLTEKFDRLPCGHPDIAAHNFWADMLYDFLNDKKSFEFKFKQLTGRNYQ